MKDTIKKAIAGLAILAAGYGAGSYLVPKPPAENAGIHGEVVISTCTESIVNGETVEDCIDSEPIPNMLLNGGGTELLKLATGDSSNHLDFASAQIGVGDVNTAESGAQTGILGNATFKGMQSSYPTTPASNSVQFRAKFLTSEANHNWYEIALKDSGSAVVFTRLTNSQAGFGTKTSAQTKYITYTIYMNN